WQGDGAAWYFLTLPETAAAEIRIATSGLRRGFGSVRVGVDVGRSRWRTSVFPDRQRNSYLLPLKVAVRKAERIVEGDMVDVRLSLLEV
ncbi:MAG: DUF1905 domain-containing protein, partial [Pseudomonadota bacterium]